MPTFFWCGPRMSHVALLRGDSGAVLLEVRSPDNGFAQGAMGVVKMDDGCIRGMLHWLLEVMTEEEEGSHNE